MTLLADAALINDALDNFLGLLLEGAFFIFIGTVISGFIDAYLPPGLMERWLPKNRYVAVLVSGLLGAVFPVCECAIVPVIRRLLGKGLPLACAVTYMLSAPVVNPIVFASTMSAFWDYGIDEALLVTLSRTFLAYGATVFVGFIILKTPIELILREKVLKTVHNAEKAAEKRAHSHDPDHAHDHKHEHDHDHKHDESHDHNHDHGSGNKLIHAMRVAQRDFTDVAMYFVVGVALTSLFQVYVSREAIDPLAKNDWLAAPAMMFMAFILSLCSTTDAFLVAAMNQFSYASRLAFMVFGPMMDVKLLFMYSSVFRPKFVAVLAIGLFLLVGFLCVQWGVIR